MTRHDELIRLQHMLDAAREAVELVRGQAALDYPNFKSEVEKADPERAHVYMGVWTALRKLRGIRT